MSTATVAGLVLIALPIAFNALFALLAARFDYPDVLRQPTAEVLARFRAGGTGLVLIWWAFALTAVALAPLAVLVAESLVEADGGSGQSGAILLLSVIVGTLAATVQFLGLVRWPFLVPYLARVDEEATDPARREAVDVVFQSFNRYLGVAVGEHLGYLLTGAWTLLVGFAITESPAVPDWLGATGVVVGAALCLCSLEFVGGFEPRGWPLAARLTPIAYVVWSLWLIATGVSLL